MALRVGIDLVDVDAVERSARDFGARYLDRVYTDAEQGDCRRSERLDPARLAARFAAKEAVLKVLRPGDDAVPWRTIEVRRDPSGWVGLVLSGRAAALAAKAGIDGLALSLSHEGGLASAVVVAETNP